ncbi:DUF4437 domain-containing protein [Sphingomonas sp. 7/4-4]|uniref:DUF4437 domain-containing protein n=1 Tax=Sphingomonas sp. 7/4-4 TaxID=3018446 RepID=UPI0022F39E6E|nr:DUF4437 domain-containing protein [Sphingomonas sp. 7/4-4]WBY06911.1 DUF4437 domain-containing protein [Sphingomonas sp. 7/4-4]
MSYIIALLAAASQAAVTVPVTEARFVPTNPNDPNSTQIAVLSGDPATGPSDMLMRFGRGEGGPHVHSSDYRLVVIEGVMKHAEAGAYASAPSMGPGSYWFQPANQPHVDSCLSDRCTMFISWSGKRDTTHLPAK